MSLQLPVVEAKRIRRLGPACTDMPAAVSEVASPDFLSSLLSVTKMLPTGMSTFLISSLVLFVGSLKAKFS